MKALRPKKSNETLPDVEIVGHERRWEIRFNFSEVSEEDENTGETIVFFEYKYIKVYDLTQSQIEEAMNSASLKEIISDSSLIDNPQAFQNRRWEELICQNEDQETIDYIISQTT